MKVCVSCKTGKNYSDFHKSSKTEDGFAKVCKGCRKISDKKSYDSSLKRRNSIKLRSKMETKKNREFASRYKRFCGCKFCGEKEPVALDLHHVNDDKEGDPSSFTSYSRSRLKSEMRKCVVLCANCHRKHHAGLLPL